MTRQHHKLKILPQYYRAVEQGKKTFEIRRNDRNFQVGDILNLQEWFGGDYTGREIRAEITYILDNREFLRDGYVALGIKVGTVYN